MRTMLDKIAQMFNTDLTTLYKSMGIGGTSTGVGYVIQAERVGWNFHGNLINLCWAVLTCIILTMVSLSITKLYRKIERHYDKKKTKE